MDNLVLDILRRGVIENQLLSSPEAWDTEPSSSVQCSVSTEVMTDSTTKFSHSEMKEKLSLNILEKESYLKSLQILKIERELGLTPSTFTAELVRKSDRIDNIVTISNCFATTEVVLDVQPDSFG